MVRYDYKTSDCDKMRFLDPCLTLPLFICLWTLCVASPFLHILKEQTSREGVTMLITKVTPIFSFLFPPESLFPFNTKSFLFIFVGVRKLVDIQAHASLNRVWSDDKWEQIFFFSSGFTWTSVKREESPLLWKKPWLFDEMATVNGRMKSVWPLCVINLTDSYRRYFKVPKEELQSISHVCRCYTSCSHSLAPCGCYWLFLATVL